MSKKIYFNPCGFGFWYQLGVLNSIIDEDVYIYGASSGSLICLISILKKKDRNIVDLLDKCNEIKNNLFKKGPMYFVNIYNYSSSLVEVIFNKMISEKYSEEYIQNKLKYINIYVTEIKFKGSKKKKLPHLKSKFINPKNIDELREFVISSCYFPILSYHKNFFYYKYKNKCLIDICFLKNLDDPTIHAVQSEYSTIIPCDSVKALQMYNKGLKYSFNNKKKTKSYSIIFFLFKTIFGLFFLLLNYLRKKIFLLG